MHEADENRELPRVTRGVALGALAALFLQGNLLVALAERHRLVFNPDAVAYVQLADHWRAGNWSLAVSGYWGPAFCWLLALVRGAAGDPATAGRLAMVVSASCFTATCLAPLWTLGLRGGWLWGAWSVAGVLALEWSVHSISPDALLSAALNLAIAGVVSPRWARGGRWAFASGALFGAAYLVKAVALPIAGLCVFTVALVRWRQAGSATGIGRAAAASLLGLGLVAGPWVAALSLKNGRLTFSTTAAIAHAVVGPHGAFGEHPIVNSLHAVEAGRVTAWEDPTGMPYPYWRPWDDAESLQHQAKLIDRNGRTMARWIARFDWLHLGLAALLLAALPRRIAPATTPWRWMGLPVAACAAIYLPVYAENSRYFYPLYAWLLGGTLAATAAMARHWLPSRPRVATCAVAIAWGSFLGVAVDRALGVGQNQPRDTPYAQALAWAEALGDRQSLEPLAGGREVGMYTALLLKQPWLGHDPSAVAAAFADVGARWCLVSPRDAAQLASIQHDGRFAAWPYRPALGSTDKSGMEWRLFELRGSP